MKNECDEDAMKTVTQQLEADRGAAALRGELEQKEETAEEARRLIGELREQIQHLSRGMLNMYVAAYCKFRRP